MRGKVTACFPGTLEPGITPARAGKSPWARLSMWGTGDHPRACGEKLSFFFLTRYKSGSPPRVRGKATSPPGTRRPPRITPARAGKSGTVAARGLTGRDHPRACGEKLRSPVLVATLQGSPPRVRGKVLGEVELHRAAGITPARAGKSNWSAALTAAIKDHPRACGEKFRCCGCGSSLQGSPPRVRGKDQLGGRVDTEKGITPARAGKSCPWRPRAILPRDHPRACGEKFEILNRFFPRTGSPPRVRGKAASAGKMYR